MRTAHAFDADWPLDAPGISKPLAVKTFDRFSFRPLFNVAGPPAI